MKWRKKPVVIESIQFTDNVEEIEQFVGQQLLCNMNGTGVCQELLIPTLEGEMTARINDWIIKGVNGEFYPCKPDIFQKTYEPANESPSLSSAEESIGFAEWCEENYCRHMSSNWIENKNAMNVAIKNSDLFSTSDLYNLYQQSKK